MNISDVSGNVLKELINPIEQKIKNVYTYEEASRIFCEEMYKVFSSDITLVRVFLTIPYGKLPEKNKSFVRELLGSNQSLLHDDTKVLSLVGTHGKENDWNSRLTSKGHVGIPLISKEFIKEIPMINGLLGQLGIDLSFDKKSTADSKSTFSGLFYVKDAKSEVDELGRHIIANNAFVKKYDVKSVFGFGGGYLGHSDFFTTIFFLNSSIKMGPAENLALTGNSFKMATRSFMDNGKCFKD